jgi:hypothetical protein
MNFHRHNSRPGIGNSIMILEDVYTIRPSTTTAKTDNREWGRRNCTGATFVAHKTKRAARPGGFHNNSCRIIGCRVRSGEGCCAGGIILM